VIGALLEQINAVGGVWRASASGWILPEAPATTRPPGRLGRRMPALGTSPSLFQIDSLL